MQRTQSFIEDGSRYDIDFLLHDRGYCQIDTAQDFSGYGNWIHLDTLKAVTFAEGDLIKIAFDEPDEVKTWLEGILDLKHIDCGISNREHNLERAAVLGVSHLAA